MNKKQEIRSLIIFILIILFTYLIYYLFTGNGIPCIFKKLTGLYCPGCGITRMFLSLLRLDIYQAFRYNPLVFILLVSYIFFTIIDLVKYSKTNKHLKISNKIYWTLLILVFCFAILRNIPLFSFLAPTVVN